MPNENETESAVEAETEAHAATIKDVDATQRTPRGNVLSEAEEPTDQQAPPPMPN